jgi:hypothetical protein
VVAQITLPIVGSQYPNKKRRGPTRRFALELCDAGDLVELRLEPENEFDENAIAVFSADDMQMGYLPAERAPYVGMMMRRGIVTAIFQGATARGGFVRIAFDGETPVLPPPPESQSPPQDWWPDEEYPD